MDEKLVVESFVKIAVDLDNYRIVTLGLNLLSKKISPTFRFIFCILLRVSFWVANLLLFESLSFDVRRIQISSDSFAVLALETTSLFYIGRA